MKTIIDIMSEHRINVKAQIDALTERLAPLQQDLLHVETFLSEKASQGILPGAPT